MTFNYTVVDAGDASVRKQIAGPLVQFNESHTGPINFRPLAVIVTGSEDNIAGGFWGATAYGWLRIDLLVVPAEARCQGVGKRLMQLADSLCGTHLHTPNSKRFPRRGRGRNGRGTGDVYRCYGPS
jgi:hypothetical protein